ncbi:DUF128 domain-containing protein [Dehalococcoides mccartyi]|jgi:hypothetical protein|uniref:DUF128 domain-containing protein n=1 Tax=Dehalococcoides mccartyi (strain VS) TaxID=311424 RepID=D2BI12_DEHMV|nr:NrpR regulatory domain-containing protein [Dehalococcoides mccartyi]ACZ61962.1 hypothetical protein DhcVS_834 [Dehalococcoides mccartyi VS]AII58006.1 hypothetical protein X792_04375 [Dehalococcoides mccartyi CG1]APH12520.1 hypothetical protein ASJ33_04815 [Dehalococcoides mccartyi]
MNKNLTQRMNLIKQDGREVEREKLAILRVLASCQTPVGSKIIARRLKNEYGVDLSERAVRYHLILLDERKMTCKISRRDGRSITQLGLEELENAMVTDKVGFVIDKIERLAYMTDFDLDTLSGMVPVNISFFAKDQFKPALRSMAQAYKANLCVSDLVCIVHEGDKISDITVPAGQVAFATVCSIVINGTLLKAGIPMDSRFGGTLQFHQHKPWRFTDMIYYTGSSLDPSEIFIASRMTSVSEVARRGEGKVLCNFREIPAVSLPLAEKIIAKLKNAGINGVLMMGEAGKSVCEMPVGLNKVGMIMMGGLNPVAAAVESNIPAASHAMSGLVPYSSFTSYWEAAGIKKPV